MEAKKIIEELLLERDAEMAHYSTEEAIKSHKERCDYLIGLLDKQEQGLLLELPLKVGDVVYGYLPSYDRKDGKNEIAPYLITNLTITQNKKGKWTKKYRAFQTVAGKYGKGEIDFSFYDIGKKVFLTEAEAEEALAKMGE